MRTLFVAWITAFAVLASASTVVFGQNTTTSLFPRAIPHVDERVTPNRSPYPAPQLLITIGSALPLGKTMPKDQNNALIYKAITATQSLEQKTVTDFLRQAANPTNKASLPDLSAQLQTIWTPVAHLSRSVAVKPEAATFVDVGVAIALQYAGQAKESAKILTTLMAGNAPNEILADAQVVMADNYYQQANFAKAQELYENALNLGGGRLGYWARFKGGWVALVQKDMATTIRLWNEALTMAPPPSPLLRQELERNLLSVLVSQGDTNTGIKLLAKRKTSNGQLLLATFAEALSAKGKFNEAITVYRAILAADPMYPDAPIYHRKMLELLYGVQNYNDLWKEAELFAKNYAKGSKWQKANVNKPTAYENAAADDLIYYSATLHEKSTQDKSLAKAAKQGYRLFLKLFPKHKSYNQMRDYLLDLELAEPNYQQASLLLEETIKSPTATPKAKESASKNIVFLAYLDFEPEFAILTKRPVDFTKQTPLSFRAQRYQSACEKHGQVYKSDALTLQSCANNIAQMMIFSGYRDNALTYLNFIVRSYPNTPIANQAQAQIRSLTPANPGTPVAVVPSLKPPRVVYQAPTDVPASTTPGIKTQSAPPVPPPPAPELPPPPKSALEQAQALEAKLRQSPKDPQAGTMWLNVARLYAQTPRIVFAKNAYLKVISDFGTQPIAKQAYWEMAQYSEKTFDLQNAASHYFLYGTKFAQEPNVKLAMEKACELHVAIESLYAANVCSYLIQADPRKALIYYQRLAQSAQENANLKEYLNIMNNFILGRIPLSVNDKIAVNLQLYRFFNRSSDMAESAANQILALATTNAAQLTPESKSARAEVLFFRAEPSFTTFKAQAVDFSSLPQFQASYQQKFKSFQDVLKTYQDIVNLGETDWGPPAMYQIGLAAEHMAGISQNTLATHPLLRAQKTKHEADAQRFIQQAFKLFKSSYTLAQKQKIRSPMTRKTLEAIYRITDRRITLEDYLPTPDYFGSEVSVNLMQELGKRQ